MRFHRALADEQLGADLLVALSCCDPLQDFDLARTERFAAHAFREFCGQSRWYASLAGVHFTNAFHQRFASGVFQQVTFRAGFDRAIDIFISIKRRQYDNVSAWIELADFFNCSNAIQFGHTQIEQHQIGAIFFPKIDSFAAVAGFRHNSHISLAFN